MPVLPHCQQKSRASQCGQPNPQEQTALERVQEAFYMLLASGRRTGGLRPRSAQRVLDGGHRLVFQQVHREGRATSLIHLSFGEPFVELWRIHPIRSLRPPRREFHHG